MSKNENKAGAANESRRDFLRVSSLAAAGFVLTPLVTACGEGEDKPKRRPRGGGDSTPKPTTEPSPNGGSKGGKVELVDTPDAVGARGAIKIVTKATKENVDQYVKLADNASNLAEASQVNGGKGPWSDQYVPVAAAGGMGVADIVFQVQVAGGKALKYQGGDAVGVNANFRFTRSIVTGKGNQVVYHVYDQVQHNINAKSMSSGREICNLNEQAPQTPPHYVAAETGKFVLPGAYNVICSMHTWELGYIYVSEHNYVGVTTNPHDMESALEAWGGTSWDVRQGNKDEANYGVVEIADVPVGEHTVKAFHHGKEIGSFKVNVTEGGVAETTFDVA